VIRTKGPPGAASSDRTFSAMAWALNSGAAGGGFGAAGRGPDRARQRELKQLRVALARAVRT
jgi:hypothetical protein